MGLVLSTSTIHKNFSSKLYVCNCWHFLTSPPGGVSSRQRRQKYLLTFLSVITRNGGVKPIPSNCTKVCHSHGIVYTITDGIRKRTDIPLQHFTRRVRVSLFICVPKDGSNKGIILNINHDIVPQAIGSTLTGVSPDKE